MKVVAGDAIGRFGSAQLPDLTARPDGTLSLIKNLQYLAKVEVHPTPKWDFYGYFGGEYDARAAYQGYASVKIVNTPAIPGCGAAGQQPCSVAGTVQPSYPATSIATNGIGGYGSLYANNTGCGLEVPPAGTGTLGGGGTCAGNTKYIFEATFGFWNKIYQGEKGRLQGGVCNTPTSPATAGPAATASTQTPALLLMPSTICSGPRSAITCLSPGPTAMPARGQPSSAALFCLSPVQI